MNCLKDRPCSVCKFRDENGCHKWNCVFEEKTESFDSVIEDIKADLEKYRAEQDKKDTFHFLLRFLLRDTFASLFFCNSIIAMQSSAVSSEGSLSEGIL